ncbi:MAG: transporter substrate-binding domain-containing protein [Gorillibacterium sp.]|nr:transporter substrate-binding domain-containing protein [Gorillibacterium sp.]
MKKTSLFISFLLVFAIVSSGCAKKAETSASASPASEATAASTSPSPETSAPAAVTTVAPADATVDQNTLESIKKAGKIVIGTGGNYRPFNYYNDKNELVGFDIDWGNIIAEGLGVKAEFVTGQFAGLISGLLANKFDILFAGVNVTEERKLTLDFSEPYGRDGVVAAVNKAATDKVASINEIKGKVVGAIAGSTAEKVANTIGGFKELKAYPGETELFADLINKRIDVVAIGRDAAGDYVKTAPKGNTIEIAGEPYTLADVAIPIRKNNKALKDAIDKIILEKKQDGTYQKLAEEHFGLTFDQ